MGYPMQTAESDQKQFLELFYGGQCHNKIAWTGKKNMLHYIFDQWVSKRRYVRMPTGAGLWQIVAAHFYILNLKNKEKTPLTAEELKDSGNPKNISDNIETLIEFLNPSFVSRSY